MTTARRTAKRKKKITKLGAKEKKLRNLQVARVSYINKTQGGMMTQGQAQSIVGTQRRRQRIANKKLRISNRVKASSSKGGKGGGRRQRRNARGRFA